MTKNIKYKRTLPIKPTNKPKGSDVAAVAMAALDIAQHSLLSPAAVVTALSCAMEVYTENLAINGGFDGATLESAKMVGTEMAKALLAPREEPAILTPDNKIVSTETGLVGIDGAPLEIESQDENSPG